MAKTVFVCIAALLLLSMSGDAFAQASDLTDPGASFDGLLQLVQQQSSQWGPRLMGYASALFWGLAGIQFVYSMSQLVFKNGDLNDFSSEMVRQILTIGFWAAFLKFSVEWNTAIVDSFRKAAGAAVGSSHAFKPADMFYQAVHLAKTISDSANFYNPASYTTIAISAIIVMLCFAFVAILMGLALIESYIVINAGVLLMGFAGSSWTRDVTMQFLKYGVSVGAKLFVLTLLVGLVTSSIDRWAAAYTADNASLFTLVGLALAVAYFCKTIPDLVQGVIAGVSPGGGSAIGGIAAAGVAAGMAAAAAAKTVATGGAAAPAAAGATANAAQAGIAASGLSAGSTASHIGQAGSATAADAAASGSASSLGARVGQGASTAATPPPAPPAGDATEAGAAGQESGSEASEPGDAGGGDGGLPAANDGEFGTNAEGSDASAAADIDGVEPIGEAPAPGASDGNVAESPEQKTKQSSLFSRFGEASAHSGRSAHAIAAMVTPGIEASPSGAGLVGPGNLGGGDDKSPETEQYVPPTPQNVIRPDNGATPASTPSGAGKPETPPGAKPPEK